jgi:DNA/RNA-binding domain of Phe-tRNA-synthetase-like protein
MIDISCSSTWKAVHPGAIIGLLEFSGAKNDLVCQSLNQQKREIEESLRKIYAGFTRKDFLSLDGMAAYEQYYKHFEKTYHVLLQVESIVIKGKNLPDVSPLVDANFAAEVQTQILTAGHDASKLTEPVVIDVSKVNDEMTVMNGTTRQVRAGDMIMRDQHGICCSIIYGQDDLSPITPKTTHVLYVSYAPFGVKASAVESQLKKIEQHVRLFAPEAVLEQSRLLIAKEFPGKKLT